MPIKRFWFYHKQIDRLAAAADLRQLHLLAGVTSQEGVEGLSKRLDEQLGRIYVYQPVAPTLDINTNQPDPELDRGALESLRASIMRHGR